MNHPQTTGTAHQLADDQRKRLLISEALSVSITAFHKNFDVLAALAAGLRDPNLDATLAQLKGAMVEALRGDYVVQQHPTPSILDTPSVDTTISVQAAPEPVARTAPTPRPTVINPNQTAAVQSLTSAKDILARLGQVSQPGVEAQPEPIAPVPTTAQLIDGLLDKLFTPQLRIHGQGAYYLKLNHETDRFALPVINANLTYLKLPEVMADHNSSGVAVIDEDRINVVFSISEATHLLIEDLQGAPFVSVRGNSGQVFFDNKHNPASVLQHLELLIKNI